MGSDQSKFSSILRRKVRRTVQKLEEVLSESRSACRGLSTSSWFPLSLKIVSQREAGLSGVECLYVRDPPILGLCRGELVFLQTSYPAGSKKPLIRWIGKTQRDGVLTLSHKVVDIKAMRFPLLEARSWQEAKSNLVTVALALPDHGVGLDGQSCSCLIVGWPVGSFISNPGCWTVDRSCSCLIVGRLIDHMSRTACFEHSNFFKVTAPEARPGQLRPGAYRRQKRQADRNWKTDETRPRPCKRKNLKLGAKRSTGKFAGKVPGKFTGDNPAIDLNPALDSVGPNSPTLRTRTVRVLGVHTDVRVCPSAHTGRPWPSVSTHRTSGCPSVHISARSVDCSGDFGPRGLSVQYTQDVRQHTQDVRGCPCVSVCPSVHTGRPSAHTGRPSAHAGRPMLTTHISMLALPVDFPCTDFGQLMHHVSTHISMLALPVD
ncbi:hypothetical protein YC2023_108313 [Brassica napus]